MNNFVHELLTVMNVSLIKMFSIGYLSAQGQYARVHIFKHVKRTKTTIFLEKLGILMFIYFICVLHTFDMSSPT